jgi:MOSC domain-containing protein YiiM
MQVLSVNVAAVGNLFSTHPNEARRIDTGIHKQPVPGAVMVRKLGLEGDRQADLRLHGGASKAVYAYPFEHYAFWTAQRLKAVNGTAALPPGSMGENLTMEGLLEKDIWIGDRLHIGSAVLEVTEPRFPCYKFNVKMGFSHAGKLMVQSGACGFYLRVLQVGAIQAGDAVILMPGLRQKSITQLTDRRQKGRQRELF